MKIVIFLLILLTTAYKSTLESKILGKYKADYSIAGARVITLDYSELLDIYVNSTDAWAILLLNSYAKDAKITNSSWSISARNIYDLGYSLHFGKIYLDLYKNSTELFGIRKDPAVVFIEYGYFYNYTNKVLVGEIMDLVVNKTYRQLDFGKIEGWTGKSNWKLIGLMIILLAGTAACLWTYTKKSKEKKS